MSDRCQGCQNPVENGVLLSECTRCTAHVCSDCAAIFDRDGGFAVCTFCEWVEQKREARRESGV